MPTPSSLRPTPPRTTGQGKNALMIWGVILLICAAALVGTYLLFVEAPPPSKIVIATRRQERGLLQDRHRNTRRS